MALCWKAALALSFASLSSARLLHSLPEDTHAFPKFTVSFLNNLPVHNQTAERWLRDGLLGGELEFLDQPWDEKEPLTRSPKEIDGAEYVVPSQPFPSRVVSDDYSLEQMKMGPHDSYLCFIPKPLDLPSPPPEEEPDGEVSLAHSWSLLEPLSEHCLYHRQGWFTYSYCHNKEIRQFKELMQIHTASPGLYKPEEDEEWESYTLGRAPGTSDQGGPDVPTTTDVDLAKANLELARGAGSLYLVQRWGDGTICDKTGRSREVEVQFHCSMAMSDTILFVKEAKTCSYVLVINTPRLCGEPGFKSRRDVGEQAVIRCREIAHDLAQQKQALPDSDQPQKHPRVKPVLPPPQEHRPAAQNKQATGSGGNLAEMIRRLESFFGVSEGQQMIIQDADNGEIIVEVIDDVEEDGTLEEGVPQQDSERLINALKAAGFDVNSEKMAKVKKNQENQQETSQNDKKRRRHQEFVAHREEL